MSPLKTQTSYIAKRSQVPLLADDFRFTEDDECGECWNGTLADSAPAAATDEDGELTSDRAGRQRPTIFSPPFVVLRLPTSLSDNSSLVFLTSLSALANLRQPE